MRDIRGNKNGTYGVVVVRIIVSEVWTLNDRVIHVKS